MLRLVSLCNVIISLITSLSARLPFLPVHVVLEGVVAAQCDQRPQAQSIGEEDLSGSVQPYLSTDTQPLGLLRKGNWQSDMTQLSARPYLGFLQFVEVGSDVEHDSFFGPGQSHPTDEENEQHEIRVGG